MQALPSLILYSLTVSLYTQLAGGAVLVQRNRKLASIIITVLLPFLRVYIRIHCNNRGFQEMPASLICTTIMINCVRNNTYVQHNNYYSTQNNYVSRMVGMNNNNNYVHYTEPECVKLSSTLGDLWWARYRKPILVSALT